MGKIQDSIDRQIAGQPKEVFYCKKCVVSNQRPRIVFNAEQVCSACHYAHEKDHVIDWSDRRKRLQMLCDKYRRNDGRFDVVVPCSGGKDSSMVAHKLKHEFGMNPLTITWSPFIHTEIGWTNFQNFIRSGYTNILATPNGHLHRKLARITFEAVGDAFQPFSLGQMAFGMHIALQFDIKLVFLGENAEAEYGGDPKNNHLPGHPMEDWADMYYKGVTLQDLIAWGKEHDLISDKDYVASDLRLYTPPAADLLKKNDISYHWMSYYHKWIPQENYYCAAEHTGLRANPDGRSEGTYSRYASLDDELDGFHYYMAFIKFGIGRATSDAAHEIRDGHITREEGVALVNQFDGEFPAKYFKEFLAYLNIDETKFWEIVDHYRRPHIWGKIDGKWVLKHRVK